MFEPHSRTILVIDLLWNGEGWFGGSRNVIAELPFRIIGYPDVKGVFGRKMEIALERMTYGPVSLPFFKAALDVQVIAKTEGGLGKGGGKKKNETQGYDDFFCQEWNWVTMLRN